MRELPFVSGKLPDAADADGGIPSGPSNAPVRLYKRIASALPTAEALAAAGVLPEWGSVLAEMQTSGRGQHGRTWISPPGNIYAAIRLPAVFPFCEAAGSPALGGMLASALTGLGISVKVKWPNDLILAAQNTAVPYRKIGGILLWERNGIITAGIGLNIASAPPDEAMRAQHAFPAGCLHSDPFRAHGLNSLADIWEYLAAFLRNNFRAYAKNWLALTDPLLLLRGEQVEISDDSPNEIPAAGCVLGLDPSGGLRLLTPSGPTICTTGSLRPPRK